jgi:serine/threonine protein kinase HipA of HipAB toxin-antitoxin module
MNDILKQVTLYLAERLYALIVLNCALRNRDVHLKNG